MTVMQSVTQTTLVAGYDPFERFHVAGTTSISPPGSARLHREPGPLGSLLGSITSVAVALAPTASSPRSVAGAVRSLTERFEVTRADFADLLPLLEFSALPQTVTDPPVQQVVPRGSAARALAAAADLSEWLGVTEEQIADIAGFSRRNYSNWRAGQGSYQKTVRGLFEIHALIGGLVRELGADGATAWMALPSKTGRPRRQLLATSSGRAQLLSEAQPLLFAKPDRESATVDFDDERIGVSAAQRSAASVIASTPPRRRRRLR